MAVRQTGALEQADSPAEAMPDESLSPANELITLLTGFGRRVRDARQKAGMTQEDLAVASGVARSYLSVLERGGRDPRLSTITRLARSMDLQPGDLLEGCLDRGQLD
jgi:DNA-binding XRE family transcriptional regulator